MLPGLRPDAEIIDTSLIMKINTKKVSEYLKSFMKICMKRLAKA